MSSEKKSPPAFNLADHKLCLGTWAWGGNVATFGPNAADTKAQEEAFVAAVDSGITFFDTAEVYSSGKSETVLGGFLKNLQKSNPEAAAKVAIATKFVPTPACLFQGALNKALSASLGRLQMGACHMYQVHGPAFSVRKVEVWAEAMAVASKAGLMTTIGVSNYNSDQVQRTVKTLEKHNLTLASNQIEYSLLHRLPETSGLIKTCDKLGVKILAYSPLAMGRLTGKYNGPNKQELEGDRKFGGTESEDKVDKLLEGMREVAAAHGAEVTCAQVALNWVRAKGCIPICGAKNGKQAKDNAACLSWDMSEEEVQKLDVLSADGASSFWQGSTK